MAKRKRTAQKGRGGRVESEGGLPFVGFLKPYFIVFIASTCGLIIEIVAARVLAPSVGVSLYTWTSIIGVVLAGISLGNYFGGRMADRFPSPTTLGFILLAGGLFSLSVLPLVNVASEASLALPTVPRIVFLTATLFLIPSLMLGMVSPVVIKLRLQDLTRTGNVVGRIYALSTAGSIFGTFIAGFLLIQWIGTRYTILLVALVLILMALIFGNLWRAKVPALACLAIFLVLGGFTIASRAWDCDCLRESNYYCIRVDDAILLQDEATVEEDQMVKVLRLDALVHSYVSPEDPTFLGSYDKIFADIVTYVAQRNPSLRVLVIGGGGYTMPRYMEEVYPQSTVEVIEIDPEVTRAAFDYLGLSPDTGIVTYNRDARMVVPELPEGQYDLVMGDAFNDLSVPYHLTTGEFNEQVGVLLKDDGIYATHVADRLHRGGFLRAYVNTLQRTFPYVYIIRDGSGWEDDSRKLYVVVGSFQPLSSAALRDANSQAGRDELVSHIMSEDAFTSWFNARENILLTDDYAPVDNLLAHLHLEKGTLDRAEEHCNAGVELGNQGRLREAMAEYDKAIHLDPQLAEAYSNRGTAYAQMDQFQQAIQDFSEAIRLNSLYTLAYCNRGTAYSQLGQYQHAIQDYDEAIRLNPQSAQVYASRALVYTLLYMDAEAQQDFDQAVKLGFESSPLQAELERLKNQR